MHIAWFFPLPFIRNQTIIWSAGWTFKTTVSTLHSAWDLLAFFQPLNDHKLKLLIILNTLLIRLLIYSIFLTYILLSTPITCSECVFLQVYSVQVLLFPFLVNVSCVNGTWFIFNHDSFKWFTVILLGKMWTGLAAFLSCTYFRWKRRLGHSFVFLFFF